MHAQTHARPNPARIVAMSAAFTIHILGFALLAMPVSRPVETLEREVDTPLVWIEPIVEKPEPLPEVKLERVKPKPVTRPKPQPLPQPIIENVALPQPVIEAPRIEALAEPFEPAAGIGTEPVEAGRLGVLFGPAPTYPRIAIRKRLEGSVTLRILVDERGRPIEIDLVESSGHRELDDAARKAVQKWRFKPAVRNGVPVRAYGTVPIVFSVR